MSVTKTHCLTELGSGGTIGMAFVAATGGLSALSITLLLLLFARNVYRHMSLSRKNGQTFEILRTPVDAYFLSLLVADLFQSVGALLNIRWAKLGLVRCGVYCNVQGAYKQLGETGVALATTVIAIHTFLVIFFHWSPPNTGILSGLVICCIWLFLLLCVSFGLGMNVDFYTPTPYCTSFTSATIAQTIIAFAIDYYLTSSGCWIGDRYNTYRILGEYLWIWIAAVLSLILYPLLFLRLRGNVVVDPEDWTRISFHLHRRTGGMEDVTCISAPPATLASLCTKHISQEDTHVSSTCPSVRINDILESPRPNSTEEIPTTPRRSDEAKLAIAMLGYPACYIILVLPLSITRWMTFVGNPGASFEPTATTLALFGLSGFVNTALFMYTRPNLLLFGRNATPNPALLQSPSVGADRGIGGSQDNGTATWGRESTPNFGHDDMNHSYSRRPSRSSTPCSTNTPLEGHSRDDLTYKSEDDHKILTSVRVDPVVQQLSCGSIKRTSTLIKDNGIEATGRVTVLSNPPPLFLPLVPLKGWPQSGSGLRFSTGVGESVDSPSSQTPPIAGH